MTQDPDTVSRIPAHVRVVSTMARKSLGVLFWTPFQSGVHKEEDKTWDDQEGVWKATNQMRWYLRKACITAMYKDGIIMTSHSNQISLTNFVRVMMSPERTPSGMLGPVHTGPSKRLRPRGSRIQYMNATTTLLLPGGLALSRSSATSESSSMTSSMTHWTISLQRTAGS